MSGRISRRRCASAEAVHLAGHHDVGKHEIDAVVLDLAQRRFGIRDAAHGIAELLEQADADGGDIGIVFDQQHRAAAAGSRTPAISLRLRGSVSRGSRIVTSVPLPSSLVTFTVPPAWCAKPCTCDRPSPVPLPTGLVVKNGSNTLSSTSGAMPVPVSATEIAT